MLYIEAFYNRWRAHTHNYGRPPVPIMADFTAQNQRLPAAD